MGRQGIVIAATLGLAATLCAAAVLAADPAPASLEGVAGRTRLPTAIKVDSEASDAVRGGQRSAHALRLERNGKIEEAMLSQSCVTAPPDLRTEKDLQALMQGLAVMQRQTQGKANGWVTMGERRGYRMDWVLGSGEVATMWMVPMGAYMAVLRYERRADFSLDDETINAIEKMEFRCGTTP
ncbi:hypothetical protein LVB77_06090 [Lysobacter sp. 5GHs7-4]|uniref:hypothetical protein n=1 Tax=Lysobacter sp. 5GHs7-4 TaxID=2904253 RepID=UPI001E2DCA3A|nr:hypothetical protein [Lysobacter sp. 5GHs7-4]UHQ24263.1 hypothetical protein LVB77_06090 [Lysobacter sp. 5GHs7-4]